MGLLLPDLVVADLGCGDGHLTLEMAGWASRVIGVDQSRDVLARARALARRQGIKNIEWKRGEIEDLPLAEASVDLAVLSQSLHHAVDPPTALGEAFRVVRTGGRVLVLELEAHDQTWVTDRLGDRWLGFTPAGLTRLMQDVGWQDIDVRSGLEGSPFGVVVAAGHKPATSRGRARRQQRSKHTR